MVDLVGRLSNPGAQSLDRVVPDELDDLSPPAAVPVRRLRPRARRLTSNEIDDLLVEYVNGERVLDLASRFGVSKSTVLHRVAAAGLPMRSKARGWSSDDLQVAVELYRGGASLASVGDHFSIGSTTVWNRFRAAGVELRSRPGWDDPPPVR